ncbi:MAG: T9SS type A sorting domain-containing protein, partial [Planctomycetes bacterium]|nr:T9SS type A sorting domain-containing protein [Planctomycetota bacterium]
NRYVNEKVNELEILLPKKFELSQNYPNPFNPATTINFALPASAEVSLKIYNVVGQFVKTLAADYYETGRYSIVWDGRNQANSKVASGVYFYHLETNGFNKTRKMILLK